MKKSNRFRASILIISAVGWLAGCSDVSVKKAVEKERKNIILGELVNVRRADKNFADLQSVELLTFKSQPIYSLNKSFAEPPKSGVDNSQINVMYDGFGNKTETRCLENDSLLRCVVLKTTADGQRQATVFGKNGEVRRLPDSALDNLMIASASNIASAAEIYEQPKTLEMLPALSSEPVTSQMIQTVMPADSKPLMIAADQTVQAAETVKPAQPEIKSETKSETVTKTAAVPPKIKVDSLWLNNNPPKKKPQS